MKDNTKVTRWAKKAARKIAKAWAPPTAAHGLGTLTQPPPRENFDRPVWELVLEDMTARDHEGRRKYGVPLTPHNGRDHLVDAYQEALDLAVYLRAEIERRRR